LEDPRGDVGAREGQFKAKESLRDNSEGKKDKEGEERFITLILPWGTRKRVSWKQSTVALPPGKKKGGVQVLTAGKIQGLRSRHNDLPKRSAN